MSDAPQLTLTITAHPQLEHVPERSYVFREAGGVIGRSAECTWSLPDDDKKLSRRHAEVQYDGSRFLLREIGKNGVFLEDRRLGADAVYELVLGSQFSFGATGAFAFAVSEIVVPARPAADSEAATEFHDAFSDTARSVPPVADDQTANRSLLAGVNIAEEDIPVVPDLRDQAQEPVRDAMLDAFTEEAKDAEPPSALYVEDDDDDDEATRLRTPADDPPPPPPSVEAPDLGEADNIDGLDLGDEEDPGADEEPGGTQQPGAPAAQDRAAEEEEYDELDDLADFDDLGNDDLGNVDLEDDDPQDQPTPTTETKDSPVAEVDEVAELAGAAEDAEKASVAELPAQEHDKQDEVAAETDGSAVLQEQSPAVSDSPQGDQGVSANLMSAYVELVKTLLKERQEFARLTGAALPAADSAQDKNPVVELPFETDFERDSLQRLLLNPEPVPGYLPLPEALDDTRAVLRAHQQDMFVAMHVALERLLAELDPAPFTAPGEDSFDLQQGAVSDGLRIYLQQVAQLRRDGVGRFDRLLGEAYGSSTHGREG